MNAEQQVRVDAERPCDGIALPTESSFELAVWRVPNGSKFVTLVDGSYETWAAYCAECVERAREKNRTLKRTNLWPWLMHPEGPP